MTSHNSIERFYDHLEEVVKVNFKDEVFIEGAIIETMPKYQCYVVSNEKYVICCRYVGDMQYDKHDKVRISGKFSIHPDTGRIILNINNIVNVRDEKQISDIKDHYKSVEAHLSSKLSKIKFSKPLPFIINKIAVIIPESDQMKKGIIIELAKIKANITVFQLLNERMSRNLTQILRYVNKYGYYDLVIFYTSESSWQYLLPLSSDKVFNTLISIAREQFRVPIMTCFEKNTKSFLRTMADRDVDTLDNTIAIVDTIQSKYQSVLEKLLKLTVSRINSVLKKSKDKLSEYETMITKVSGKVFYSSKESKLMHSILKTKLQTFYIKLDQMKIAYQLELINREKNKQPDHGNNRRF
jgi:exonuclease VII large subunit